MSVTQQGLLDAMDGITMILDPKLHIIQIGEPNWQQFFEDNPPRDAEIRNRSNESVFNRPVTQFIAGDAVRTTFADLFNSVLTKTRPAVRVDYRCDAPTLRREMRLSVRPIKFGDDVCHLLYQSITLSILPRPAIPLFGAAVAEQVVADILTLCAICARVAWPVGAPPGAREWIEPSEYYQHGGDEVALLSHGFCEDCFARIHEED